LPRCLDEFARYVSKAEHDIEVVIAEDGSTDRTLEIANEFARKYRFVKIVSSKVRLGKGGGILNGIESSTGDIVLYMDVDMAVTPDQIPRLVNEILKGADVAMGSRVHPSSVVYHPPVYRVFLGRLFNTIIRLLFRLDYFDTQTGFKAFRREAIFNIINQVNTDGFAFDADLVIKAHEMGYKVGEIPIVWHHKPGSKVSPIKQAYKMFFDLLRIRLELFANKWFKIFNEKECKKFYDEINGDAYYRAEKSFFPPRRMWHSNKNSQILRLIPSGANKIVDLGAGSGNLATRIASIDSKAEVVGIDIGRNFVKFLAMRAKSMNLGNLACIECTIEGLPFADKVVDIAILSETLEYVPNQKLTLHEINRILRSYGFVIIVTPRAGLRWGLVRALWTLVRKEKLEVPYFPLSISRLRYLLLGTGFHLREIRLINLGCVLVIVAEKQSDMRTHKL